MTFFFLPINILTVWHAGFLGYTTHYLIISKTEALTLNLSWVVSGDRGSLTAQACNLANYPECMTL